MPIPNELSEENGCQGTGQGTEKIRIGGAGIW